MFCSRASAILGQDLSIVSCGSLEYCGLASIYILKIYKYISVVYIYKFPFIKHISQ